MSESETPWSRVIVDRYSSMMGGWRIDDIRGFYGMVGGLITVKSIKLKFYSEVYVLGTNL